MSKTRLEKIASIGGEIEQLKNRQKLLLQQHNTQERKARTHRLCKRGGIVEKLLPGLAALTDSQFDTFVEQVMLSGYAEKVLSGLAERSGKAAADVVAAGEPQDDDDAMTAASGTEPPGFTDGAVKQPGNQR